MPFSTQLAKFLSDRKHMKEKHGQKKTHSRFKRSVIFIVRLSSSVSGVMLTSRFTIGHVKGYGRITVKPLRTINDRQKCLIKTD